MSTLKQTARRIVTHAMPSFVFLALLYTLLIFILPASHETMSAYRLAPLEYRIIFLAVSLPSLMVWFVAFMGSDRLRQYAASIRNTSEGPHFNTLARGSTLLAWSLPLPALIALLTNAVAGQWSGFHPSAIIIVNYVSLLLPLLAFSYIGSASRGLANSASLKLGLASIRALMLIFVTAGVLYCYLVFRNFDLGSLASAKNPYFLPIWLVVVSIIIPYLYAWFVGLLAAYEITLFSKHVQGLLYRQALRLVVGGLLAVLFSSIALQYLNGIRPSPGYLTLDYRLLLTLVFRILGGIGFVLLIIGAGRLKKIEEV